MKKTICFFDEHGIFIDTDLLKLRLELIRDLKLSKEDAIVLGGDATDNYCISDFKKVDKNVDVLYESSQMGMILNHYRNVSKSSKIVWIEGNHEDRHERNLDGDNLAAYRSLKGLSFEEIFHVEKYKVNYVRDVYEVTPGFIITHGERCGKFPARGELDKWGTSGMSGHAHKTDYASKTQYNGRIEWFSCGHLADKSKIDMSCKYSKKMMWDRSFALILSEGNKIIDVEVIRCDGNGFYCKHTRRSYGKEVLRQATTKKS